MEKANSENRKETYDVIIIGSGPASHCAALYLQEYSPILFEGTIIGTNGPGGQLTTTTNVDNYPGIPNIQGPKLMKNIRNQILSTDKIKIITETIIKVKKINNHFECQTNVKKFFSRVVIIGTGAQAKRLYVKGTNDNEFWNKGISACAICDGWPYHGLKVGVIGGGDTAMEESLYLSGIAEKVYLIHRSKVFRARKDMLEKVKQKGNIEIITDCQLVEAMGDDVLRSIRINRNNLVEVLKVDGLFFAIGHKPNSDFVEDIEKYENGYIKTNSKMETNIKGLFACGDVQDFIFRQAITAASSGSIAALNAIKYLKSSELEDNK